MTASIADRLRMSCEALEGIGSVTRLRKTFRQIAREVEEQERIVMSLRSSLINCQTKLDGCTCSTKTQSPRQHPSDA